mmetsp:Transcript_38431/g.52216  ORF Transcript_38431/g.52216 Transcript_38431/m.52216 type:complete len:125 (+) Transcript_38431:279-653(+)
MNLFDSTSEEFEFIFLLNWGVKHIKADIQVKDFIQIKAAIHIVLEFLIIIIVTSESKCFVSTFLSIIHLLVIALLVLLFVITLIFVILIFFVAFIVIFITIVFDFNFLNSTLSMLFSLNLFLLK